MTEGRVRVALVVAMADNRVIGAKGGLPWRIPADLKHFKAVTMGKPIVMGRRTYDSIGKPLPGRPNIVVTRGGGTYPDGLYIGGATLYEALLPRADRLYLTEIHETAEGDTYFPAFDKGEWREVAREDRDDIYRAPVSFVTLDRRG